MDAVSDRVYKAARARSFAPLTRCSRKAFRARVVLDRKRWQERRDSNPQPPVLETGALPIELHS